LHCQSELATVRAEVEMKITESTFQRIVQVGAWLLAISTIGNVYLLLRHRELYRDASRTELTVQQKLATFTVQQMALEGVIRDFAARRATDPGVAEIFQRWEKAVATNATARGAQP
jgi:hypothetical protein